ncbi:MAG: methanogenesis marker 16 metalloprotein, partial [Desulfobacula sp.]|nr:methanogenesis marker 16 metalloprotein [Desulfobacula sp.]
FSFKVAEADTFIKAQKVWINDIPAKVGPCPNERIGILDLIVLGTQPSIKDPDYGGGDLFKDLVSGKHVQVKIETDDGQQLSSTTTLRQIPHAMLHASRNAFKNYLAFVNPGKAAVSTIFHSEMMKGNYEEMSFCGCGELNPLENDPKLKTIGVGTKVLINGAPGYVTGAGTRSSVDKPNLTGFADMHKMDPALMGGFATGHGPDIITTWAVPIPILDKNMLIHILKLDEQIPLKVVDVRNRKPIFEVTYHDVWGSCDHEIRFNETKCQQCDVVCRVNNICPVKAIYSKSDTGFIFDKSKCFNCGLCVSVCNGHAFSANMGSIEFKGRNIPVTIRQSNRAAAIRAAQDLKKQIQDKLFKITKPVGEISFPDNS